MSNHRGRRPHSVGRATRWVALAVWLTGSVGIVGCGDEPVAPKEVVRPVKIVEFGGSGEAPHLEYPGEVSPATNAEVAFEVSGKLIEFPVTESQLVAEGDILAKLDPRDYQANLDAANATAGAARADYDRMKALFERDVASKQQLDRAQRNFEVTLAQVNIAKKAVDDTMLRAPFAGTIARKIADDFDNVQAKQPIVLLQTGSALEVIVNMPEKDYARIQPGLTIEERSKRANAKVILSAIPDRTFPADLKEFATAADPTTRTFSATFAFEPPGDINVMPGMTARVVLEGAALESSGSTIPAQAAVEDGADGPYVWVADRASMTVSKARVTLGALTGSSVEVQAGLRNGDLVVTSGVHQLRDGMTVRRLAN